MPKSPKVLGYLSTQSIVSEVQRNHSTNSIPCNPTKPIGVVCRPQSLKFRARSAPDAENLQVSQIAFVGASVGQVRSVTIDRWGSIHWVGAWGKCGRKQGPRFPAIWGALRVILEPTLHCPTHGEICAHVSSHAYNIRPRVSVIPPQMLFDCRPLVRVAGCHQKHRVAEHLTGDRAYEVIRFLLRPLSLQYRLSDVFTSGQVDHGVISLDHRARLDARVKSDSSAPLRFDKISQMDFSIIISTFF